MRDRTRRIGGRELGAGREVGVDDVLAVDADGDGLPHLLVVERRERVVETHVEDVHPGPWCEREADVVGDTRDHGRIERVDAVDGPVLQLGHACRAVGVPADDQPLVGGLGPPVGVVSGEADLGSRVPFLEPVGARPVDRRVDGLGARLTDLDVRAQPGRIVDRERGPGDLGQERDVGPAQFEDDGRRILGGDPL